MVTQMKFLPGEEFLSLVSDYSWGFLEEVISNTERSQAERGAEHRRARQQVGPPWFLLEVMCGAWNGKRGGVFL